MENFVTDFNVVTNIILYVFLVIVIVSVIIAFTTRIDNREQKLKLKYNITDDTEKQDYPKEYIEKCKNLEKSTNTEFIIILITALSLLAFVFCKPYNKHVNDLKENYNITIKDNQVTFNIKKSSIYMDDSKTFNALKVDNKYILSDVKKPYKSYELTENEFIDLFTDINKPANSIDINKELQEKGIRG